VPDIRLLALLFIGFNTLLKPWELNLLAPPNWLFPAIRGATEFFMKDMFIVVGKFLRLAGSESAIFLKEGLLSSLLSSMSLSNTYILSGYLFLTMLSLFSS